MLYLFAEYDDTWYMPIPPLGEMPMNQAISFGFDMMERLNRSPSVSRIENLSLYEMQDLDLKRIHYRLKSWDYLYDRVKLSGLKGDSFKGKRVSYNHFVKHYSSQYVPFSPADAGSCLRLYDQWMERKKRSMDREADDYSIHLLEDSRKAHRRMMEEMESLSLVGRVVRIGPEIKGYIIGTELNESTFIVLAEVTDLTVRGLAQYIFREFCKEMKEYQWINVMDDSGLLSLRKVKESYHPSLEIPAYMLVHR